MYHCEYGFMIPDPSNQNYSMKEPDFYQWIPPRFQKKEENHRLSLRKNLITNEYELYKYYHRSKRKIIVFKSKDLRETIDKSNEIWNFYHSSWSNDKKEDKICLHTAPEKDIGCEVYQKILGKEKILVK